MLGSTAVKALFACVIVWFTSALSSCDLIEGPSPVQVMGAQIVIGDDPVSNSHTVAMHYTLRNSGSRDISTVHISFYMYDTSGNPVPSGNNYFDITFGAAIPVGSEVTGATNLDSSFSYLPLVDLIANQFHVYKVELSDGSSWTDWLGLYVYPYNVTSLAAP